MATTTDRIAALERAAGRDVGRNIDALATYAAGGLAGAVASLAAERAPAVAVLTGCFIPWADPPAPETDGPPGAALLAGGLAATGVPARLVTDPACERAVSAVAAAAGVPLDVCATEAEAAALARDLRAGGVTHVVAVERLGPGADGRVRNMRGDDVTEVTAPLHALVGAAGLRSVGIGDGGNEIGMGGIPADVVAANVEHGADIRCTVACDHLIVCGVSNWGAVALLLGVALARGDLDTAATWADEAAHDRMLTACVRTGGAVDGTTGERSLTVDGLDVDVHHDVLRAMRGAVATCSSGAACRPRAPTPA